MRDYERRGILWLVEVPYEGEWRSIGVVRAENFEWAHKKSLAEVEEFGLDPDDTEVRLRVACLNN